MYTHHSPLSLDLILCSADIMGYANTLIEQTIGGVSLFVNADAGDIDPGPVRLPTLKPLN